jgi:hypothetical protein
MRAAALEREVDDLLSGGLGGRRAGCAGFFVCEIHRRNEAKKPRLE